MTKYDFETIIDRRGTGCLKWDAWSRRGHAPDDLPLWVADMDFKTAPAAIEALAERVQHGVFGYTMATDGYCEAVQSWFERRHGWRPEREWLVMTPGVVFALAVAINAFTQPGDHVIIQPPVYYPFRLMIQDNGRKMAASPLLYRDGRYIMDYEGFERQLEKTGAKLFILCNPHNPVGRAWTADELRRIGDICLRRDILVVADEIHCELVMPGFRYTPFASLSEEFARRSVTCASPSKAFNLAGVQVANIFAADAGLRERIARSLEINETGMISPFAIETLTAAYTDGAEWLDALNGYLWENYLFLRDYFARHLPQFPVLPLEGTYLVWADCRAAGLSSDALTRRLLDEGRLHVNSGSMYGAAGEGFIRLNIACPRKLLAEGLDRLKRVLTT